MSSVAPPPPPPETPADAAAPPHVPAEAGARADAAATPPVPVYPPPPEHPVLPEPGPRPAGAEPQHVIVDRVKRVDRQHSLLGRWLRRLASALLLILLLLLLGFVGISLVLRSAVPRAIAERVATGLVGLDVELGRLSVAWDGGVGIDDLVVRLPGAVGELGPVVLEVPRIDAKLPFLPLVAFEAVIGGTPLPEWVRVTRPTVYMTQDDEGRWTLPQAADILIASLTSGGGDTSEPSRIELPPLPAVAVEEGTLVVRDNAGREERVSDVTLDAGPDSPLVYAGRFDAPGVAGGSLKLVPHSGRTQRVEAVVGDGLRRLAGPFVELPELAASVVWQGNFTDDGGFRGTLSLRDGTQLAGIRAAGDVAARLDGEVLRVGAATSNPSADDRLRLEGLPGLDGEVRVVAGDLVIGPQTAYADGLLLAAAGGDVLVDAFAVNLEDRTATLRLAFRDVAPVPGFDVSGRVDGDLWYGAFGEPRAALLAVAGGMMAGRQVDEAGVRVEVAGDRFRDFRTLDVAVALPDGAFVRGDEATRDLPIPPLRADVEVRLDDTRPGVADPHVRLADLRTAGGSGTLTAEGIFYLPQPDSPDPAKHAANYGLFVDAAEWPVQLPRIDEPLPLAFGTLIRGQIADGQVRPVEIGALYANYGDVAVTGRGWYVIDPDPLDPTETQPAPPLSLDLVMVRRDDDAVPPATDAADEDGFAFAPAVAPDNPRLDDADETFRGELAAYVSVWGDPLALDLWAEGRLDAEDFGVGPYEVGDVATGFEARVLPESLTFATTDARLLDAVVAVSGDVPYDKRQAGVVNVTLEDLSLERLSNLVALEIAGEPVTGDVDVRLEARLRGFAFDRVRATGTVVVTNLATGLGPLADEVVLRPVYLQGRVTLPVEVRRAIPDGMAVALGDPTVADGDVRRIALTLDADLNAPDRVVVRSLIADGYPLNVKPDLITDAFSAAATLELAASEIAVRLATEQELADAARAQRRGDGDTRPAFNSPLRIDGDLSARLVALGGPNPFDLATILDAELEVRATGDRVTVGRIAGVLPDVGTLRGGGTIALGDVPGRSNLLIRADVRLDTLAERLQLPEGGEGTIDVALNVRPSPGARPRGDVTVDLAFSGRDARWRTLQIDRGQIVAFLSRVNRPDGSPPQGPYDFTVFSTEQLRIFAGGGVLEGYAKYRDRRSIGQAGRLQGDRFAQVTLRGDRFDLGQLGPFVDRPETRGRASISLNAFGPLSIIGDDRGVRLGETDLASTGAQIAGRFNGGGSIRVREARLASIDIFRVILEAAQLLRLSARDEVDLDFRLDNGNLSASGFRVFVDGVEIRGNVRVLDLFSDAPSPLSGAVVVLPKPLDAIPLPFLGGAQEILDAITANATALRLRGTLDNPIAEPAVLGDVGETIGALLGR